MRTVAYYLPQFHEIPENNEWWGEGFTEWVNVERAKPLFDGHDHPRLAGPLGQYDLTDPSIPRKQTELALQYGIDAFCIYFYWFNGQRLLEAPLNRWRDDSTLLPYCISWANESWTRRWDGKSRDVLMAQDYADGYADALFADMLPHFRARHYLRQHGKPILVVHRVTQIPDVKRFVDILRGQALRFGLPGIYLVAAETEPGIDPRQYGFDAVAEFPPVGANTLSVAHWSPVKALKTGFRGRLLSYERLANRFESRKPVDYVRHRGVVPGWDNTARRGLKATVYVGATPDRYERWLRNARRTEWAERQGDGIVFVNAWNEWAEGAYLEPDGHHGLAYLEATSETRTEKRVGAGSPDFKCRFWSRGQIHSFVLLAAGSVLARLRTYRNGRRMHR